MSLRLTALIFASLCVTFVQAAPIQPVEASLQPMHARIASIEIEIQTLARTKQNLVTSNEDRMLAERKVKSLQSEKRRLEAEIKFAKDIAHSPLVSFIASSNDEAR
ncbi:hypothetical protein AEP_00061 [Curvibacter sp. AEP1-3]|uniref:hypothetical protein n=1 Tax=Curvibacter sp. AEP1-3 TaxID=1844971 RepID=UPI000B3C7FFC|nr:hypothetical protein [Curvibacter sp. AEP1-3]ARV17027.1 hypothetical protein AEP_00061 [Curvibacter sp. AEP1-3]